MAQYAGRRLREHFDWVLLVIVLTIAVMGVLNLRSASVTIDTSAHVTQLVWFILGGVACALVTGVDYRLYLRLSVVYYAVVLGLLVLVFFVGKEVNGARRWIALGSFTIQPSELMKVGVILVTARFFHGNRRSDGYSLRDLVQPFCLLALPVLLILEEPDLGTALIIVFIFGSMLAMERLQRKTWVVLLLSLSVAVPSTYLFGLKDYQRKRIETFLHPERDRFDTGWQARQSVIAVGSGQISGKGYMGSTQSFGRFLPETRTDFILATFAEEHGFLGCLVLLVLYSLLICWAVNIASSARERFGAILCVGVAAMVFWHVMVNVGMVIGLLPIVGVPLPLFSYGGSSVLTNLIGIGLLFNVSMRRRVF